MLDSPCNPEPFNRNPTAGPIRRFDKGTKELEAEKPERRAANIETPARKRPDSSKERGVSDGTKRRRTSGTQACAASTTSM
jgi:hypothetical protein